MGQRRYTCIKFDGFNINLYENPNNNNNEIVPQPSVIETNSYSSFVCTTFKNFTESCDIPYGSTGKITLICE